MTNLNELITSNSLKGKQHGCYVVEDIDNFRYEDPIDKSISENQVNFLFIYFLFLLYFQLL